MRKNHLFCVVLVCLFGLGALAQDMKGHLIASIDAKQAQYADVAKQIWNFAEVGYQEVSGLSN